MSCALVTGFQAGALPIYRIAAGGDAPAGDDRMDERARAAPDHRHPESRRNAEMLDVIFIDALRMVNEQALEHGEAPLLPPPYRGLGAPARRRRAHPPNRLGPPTRPHLPSGSASPNTNM